MAQVSAPASVPPHLRNGKKSQAMYVPPHLRKAGGVSLSDSDAQQGSSDKENSPRGPSSVEKPSQPTAESTMPTTKEETGHSFTATQLTPNPSVSLDRSLLTAPEMKSPPSPPTSPLANSSSLAEGMGKSTRAPSPGPAKIRDPDAHKQRYVATEWDQTWDPDLLKKSPGRRGGYVLNLG